MSWQALTKAEDTYNEGTGQRYPHPGNISIIFSYFVNNSCFYSQLVKMVAPGGLLGDRVQAMEIRTKKKKTIKTLKYEKGILVDKR